jgi:hypothetical protein
LLAGEIVDTTDTFLVGKSAAKAPFCFHGGGSGDYAGHRRQAAMFKLVAEECMNPRRGPSFKHRPKRERRRRGAFPVWRRQSHTAASALFLLD